MKIPNPEKKIDLNLDRRAMWVFVIAVFFIVLSFFSPLLFTIESPFGLNFDKTGEIGDTIGGIMNPFIAIAGFLMTFLAFYIQYRANLIQIGMFRTELTEQQVQFKKSQFENQFYEMLRLHKENVNSIQLTQIKFQTDATNSQYEITLHGMNAFYYFQQELELYFAIAKKHFPNKNYCLSANMPVV